MSVSLAGRIGAIVSLNGMTACVNLATTVLLARWFGFEAYADYLLALSALSIALLTQEVVPTAYTLFRVQDERSFLQAAALATFIVASMVSLFVFAIGEWSNTIPGYSRWMALAALALGVKRYQDIRLQSSGRLKEYFRIDLNAALIRLTLMGIAVLIGAGAQDAIWSALAVSLLLAQLAWFVRSPEERLLVRRAFRRTAWAQMLSERQRYLPYYVGVVLKRTKDNLVPFLSVAVLPVKEIAGAFLMAYRGLSFVLGQIRVIEGVVNHRLTLAEIERAKASSLAGVALLAQVLSVALSVIMLVAAGAEHIPMSVAVLSFVPWFYTFSVIWRAKAHSRFDPASVNAAMAAHLVVCGGILILPVALVPKGETFLAAVLVLAEAFYLAVLLSRERARAGASVRA
jgi:hypothetical protein